MSMLKSNGSGVEFESNDQKGGHQGGTWAAGVGGLIVGAIAGNAWAQNHGGNDHSRNHGRNGGRGADCDDAYVTRFELEQEDKLATERAKSARLEAQISSESYTNKAILDLRAELVAKNKEQDALARENEKLLYKLEGKEELSEERLTCLRDSLGEVKTGMIEMRNSTAKAIRESRKATEAWVENGFVQQPKVKICGDDYSIECADSTED